VSLAFLSVLPGEAIARSPMERLARAAGAVVEERDGWNVVTSYGAVVAERTRVAQTVGFCDRSWMRKFEVRTPAGAATPGNGSLPVPVQVFGAATRTGGGGWRCPITPERTLLLGGDEPVPDGALDLTCAHAALELAGPLAGECLARFCAIDVRPSMLPACGFRPGSVARTPGYVLRTRPDALLILTGWAYGEYLWETVATAAERVGGGPVGTEALDA
jgi:glycine cleavage system aminomethyltransferase T